jgi:hypothetical protein
MQDLNYIYIFVEKKCFGKHLKKYSTGSLPSYKVTLSAIKSCPWGVGVAGNFIS